jgi:8-oxo-dGTP pyrophosphatase MutT (NUDIX family)
MVTPEICPAIKERVRIHASVGVLVGGAGSGYRSLATLLLVRQKESQKWGLVAGRLQKRETPEEALWRELWEEANLTLEQIVLRSPHNPRLITQIREEEDSFGLIFEARLKVDLPPEGYTPQSEEIDLVKQFPIQDLVDLMHNPESIYRPDFNLGLIRGWIMGYLDFRYGTFEGPDFVNALARSWGLID